MSELNEGIFRILGTSRSYASWGEGRGGQGGRPGCGRARGGGNPGAMLEFIRNKPH